MVLGVSGVRDERDGAVAEAAHAMNRRQLLAAAVAAPIAAKLPAPEPSVREALINVANMVADHGMLFPEQYRFMMSDRPVLRPLHGRLFATDGDLDVWR